MNLWPGALLIAAISHGLDPEPPNPGKLWGGDWFGIASMAIGLGSLITMLEEGEREDWFGDPLIRDTAVLAAIFIPVFVIREWMCRRPFINLRLLKQRSFASASAIGLFMGLALYGTVYVMPVYLAQIHGYDAEQIGEVVMWMGLPQLIVFPLVPWTMRHFDARLIVAFDFTLFAVSRFMNSLLTHDWAIQQLRWSQLVRAAGQPFIIVPLSNLATAAQPPSEQADASAIFNVMRNLGGSGIAALSTFITLREQYHFVTIGDWLTRNSHRTTEMIQQVTRALGSMTPGGSVQTQTRGVAQVARLVRREAFVMACSDCFFVISVALVLCIFAPALIRRSRRPAMAH